jgi:hypothetical protein
VDVFGDAAPVEELQGGGRAEVGGIGPGSFSQVLAGHFTTAEVYPRVLQALGFTAEQYHLNSLRYDLSKLRVKALAG